ncbi:MAG: YlbF family regulator [Clostridiales bacterium]|nr:YlbF family regulator [Clostridiales bacterium]
MKTIEQATDEFIAMIRQTEEYQEYQIQKNKIDRYPELKQQINDYRQKNYQMQLMGDTDELFERIDEFQKEYEQFREDPLVSDFLAAELAFCRMIQEINIRIMEGVDFENPNTQDFLE